MEDFNSPASSEDSFWGNESDQTQERRSENSSEEGDNAEKNISLELLSGLKQFRETKMFCDVVLKAGVIDIYAHKVILSACSPYFNAMFSGRFDEKNKSTVIVEDMDGTILNVIIDYIYTGELFLTKENVRDVLFVANFLQITSAENICCKLLCEDVNEENCIEFMDFAGKRSLKLLFKEATQYAAKSFCKIMSNDNFLSLDFAEIDGFLSENSIENYSDDIIFSAIHKWIDYSPKERIVHCKDLLNHVSPLRVTKDLIKASKHLHTQTSCRDWLSKSESVNSKEWFMYVFNKLCQFTPRRIPLRQKILAGGISRMPEDICYSTYCAYGGTIFAQGGWISRQGYTNKTYAFDVYKNSWTEFVPLSQPRILNRACALGQCLFNIGGVVNLNCFDIVEQFDLMKGQYINCNPLKMKRAAFGICVYENCIYVVGGHNGDKYLSTIERYDPRVGTWELLPSTTYSRGECSSAVFQSNIYCSMDGDHSLERFDIRNNEWTLIQTLNDIYAHEIFSTDDSLFGQHKHEIVKYSPLTGMWESFLQLRPASNFSSNSVIVVPVEHNKQRS